MKRFYFIIEIGSDRQFASFADVAYFLKNGRRVFGHMHTSQVIFNKSQQTNRLLIIALHKNDSHHQRANNFFIIEEEMSGFPEYNILVAHASIPHIIHEQKSQRLLHTLKSKSNWILCSLHSRSIDGATITEQFHDSFDTLGCGIIKNNLQTLQCARAHTHTKIANLSNEEKFVVDGALHVLHWSETSDRFESGTANTSFVQCCTGTSPAYTKPAIALSPEKSVDPSVCTRTNLSNSYCCWIYPLSEVWIVHCVFFH